MYHLTRDRNNRQLREDYFLPLHQGEDDVLRFLLYTPSQEKCTGEFSPIGAGAHSDYGTMTLLFQGIFLDIDLMHMQDSVGGLQVKSRDDNWIDAQVIPDTIL